MDELRSALSEIGMANGIALELDDAGACDLETADGGVVHVQYRANLEELDFVAPLGAVPDAAEQGVYRELLAANFYWRETVGATLSYSVELDQVVLAYPLNVAVVDRKEIEVVFTSFMELRSNWIQRLADLIADEVEEGDDAGELIVENLDAGSEMVRV